MPVEAETQRSNRIKNLFSPLLVHTFLQDSRVTIHTSILPTLGQHNTYHLTCTLQWRQWQWLLPQLLQLADILHLHQSQAWFPSKKSHHTHPHHHSNPQTIRIQSCQLQHPPYLLLQLFHRHHSTLSFVLTLTTQGQNYHMVSRKQGLSPPLLQSLPLP